MEERKPYFDPKPTGTSNWKLRLRSILRAPFHRTGPACVTVTVIWVVAYNVGVRWWKGEDHPINRFNWRLKEGNNELSQELLAKKNVVNAYHKERFFYPKESRTLG